MMINNNKRIYECPLIITTILDLLLDTSYASHTALITNFKNNFLSRFYATVLFYNLDISGLKAADFRS